MCMYVPRVMYIVYVSRVTCKVSCVTVGAMCMCHVSNVRCHVLGVMYMCHVSHVKCHVLGVMCI